MKLSDFSAVCRVASRLRQQFPIVIPGLILLALTGLLQWTTWDFAVSQYFYDFEQQIWPHKDRQPWELIDQYFVLPGMILGIGSLVWVGHRLVRQRLTPDMFSAAVIAGTLLIGPGLLVNGTMKPIFSRPRPRQIVELGGHQQYQPVFGFGEELHFNASFPSGHASIGFFLITPAFIVKRRRLRYAILTGGLAYGSLMSLSRIVQGGHYLSDVTWSLAIVYGSAWLCTLTAELWQQSLPTAEGICVERRSESQTKPAVHELSDQQRAA